MDVGNRATGTWLHRLTRAMRRRCDRDSGERTGWRDPEGLEEGGGAIKP